MPFTDPTTGQTLYTTEEASAAVAKPGTDAAAQAVRAAYSTQTAAQNAYVVQQSEAARVAALTQEQRQAETLLPQIEALRSAPNLHSDEGRWAQYVEMVNQYSRLTGQDQSALITQAVQGSGVTRADIARMSSPTGTAFQSEKSATSGLSAAEAAAGYRVVTVTPEIRIGDAAKYDIVQKNITGMQQATPSIGAMSEKSGTMWTGTGWVNEQSPQSRDIIARSDVYAVTDPKQLALMQEKGLTSYQAAAELLRGATTLQEKQKYETALTQAWTTATGKSAEYHNWASATGLAQLANPYEYTADLFTYAMKGYPTREAERFSPVDYTILGLPGGKGEQAYTWGTKGYDLTGAMGVVAKAEKSGEMGPYGAIPAPTTYSWDSKTGTYVQRELSLAEQQAIGVKSATWLTYPEAVWKEPKAWVGTLGMTEITFKTPEMYKSSSYEVTPTLTTPIIEPTVQMGSTRIERATGEIPLFGVIPVVSDFISFVSPQQKITTTTKITEEQPTISTVGGTTTITSGKRVEEKSISELYASPLDVFLRGEMPKPGTKEAGRTAETIFGGVSIFTPQIGMPSKIIQSETDFVNYITGDTTKEYVAFIPLSKGFVSDVYSETYESPSRSLVSSAIPVALVGAGTALRMAGTGETWLTAESTAGKIYQEGSKIASASLIGMYASDVVQRVSGSTPGEIEQKFFPMISTEGRIETAKGPSAAYETLQTQFPGIAESRKALTGIETQELAPMTLAFAGAGYASAKLSGWYRTRGVPEIEYPKTSGYMASEGFPTSGKITTKDLIESFKTGTITLEKPEALSKVIMAPYGEELSRIPVGTQIGAAEGKSFIYTGAEYPFLKVGYVGESASELPAMFTAPQRISYFTKAGASQAGGFGITSDIFGIYNLPLTYRVSTPKGEYQRIPEELLRIKNPTNPITGEEWSVNDPANPRNIKIAEWLRTEAKPGIPAIGQYGKSEWQYLIPSGSEVKAAKMTGFYREQGMRVPQYDVEFNGLRSEKYVAPEYKVSSGERMYEVGRARAEAIGESIFGTSERVQRIIPISISPSTEKSISKSISKAISESTGSSESKSYAKSEKTRASSNAYPKGYESVIPRYSDLLSREYTDYTKPSSKTSSKVSSERTPSYSKYDVTTMSYGETTRKPPYSETTTERIRRGYLPSIGPGWGGGMLGQLSSFKFTESLATKSARDIMFGSPERVKKGKGR